MLSYWDYDSNNYKGERTKIGNFFYNITKNATAFLMKHIWLYYALNYSWGIITVIIGWLLLGFLKLFFNKKIVQEGKFGPAHFIMIFDNWGGLEMGVNFLLATKMGEDYSLHTKCHETGHTFQNAIYGPLAIFLIYLPSAIRYWYQRIRRKHGKQNKDYDAIWFEESATDIGSLYYKKYLEKTIK